MKANDIRQSFIDYFVENNHGHVSSSSLVPQNDPTLLFVNSGMVQFKDIFTGKETPDSNRAVTAQKCLRAGGKHNDLDNVGYTARHHTFFEMLGNFSFGDYFKEQAIYHAWQFVHKIIGIPKEKLLVTIYHNDEDAANYWRSIAGLTDDKIIRIASSDNFWQMGDVGPCGPCSEIFYDHGTHVWGGPPGSPNEDGDRFIEIWNLVFMQYEQFKDGKRENLPKPSIDTGMGLERIAAVLQNKHNNYDVDHLYALVSAAGELTKQHLDSDLIASLRIIADHLRASAFLIADGVLPSNEGRGYVLRRIMRRGMRHAFKCGATDLIFHQLVPVLISQMGTYYHELERAKSLIMNSLKNEEEKFQKLLGRGIRQLSQSIDRLSSDAALPGEEAFILYDTYGFPIDLTADILREQGRIIDMNGFHKAMAEQRDAARKAWAGTGDQENEKIWFSIRDDIAKHHDGISSEFLGYSQLRAMASIQAIVKDNNQCESLNSNDKGAIITNQTPFYGESGGQIGDTGHIFDDDDNRFIVTDTLKKADKLFVHYGYIEKGRLQKNQAVYMEVDIEKRQAVSRHHSVTHLLHKALREILGDHVTQKGSLVERDYLRFDFAHYEAISINNITQIEELVNQQILNNNFVRTAIMTRDDAINAGAMALFGEKYGEEVRVVSMGDDNWSIELCGGTHVVQTGDIGSFKIINEQSVASGVRRIEAVCGIANMQYHQQQHHRLQDIAKSLNVAEKDIVLRLQQLLQERKVLEQENQKLKRNNALNTGQADDEGNRENINDIAVIALSLQDIPAKELRNMAEELLKNNADNAIAIIFTTYDHKASFVIAVSKPLCEKINAVTLVKSVSHIIGGKGGGGRPDMAQAGGDKPENIPQAISMIKSMIREL